jgi:hypothetical protein
MARPVSPLPSLITEEPDEVPNSPERIPRKLIPQTLERGGWRLGERHLKMFYEKLDELESDSLTVSIANFLEAVKPYTPARAFQV